MITKVFQSGMSPEVEVFKRHNEIVIREKPKSLARAFELLIQLPEDFFTGRRKDLPPQERKDM